MELSEKIFMQPGDIVNVKMLTNSPDMVVKKKVTVKAKDNEFNFLIGLLCFWFSKDGFYQESVFNTKDLKLKK